MEKWCGKIQRKTESAEGKKELRKERNAASFDDMTEVPMRMC
jgi:hypothetical protein